MTIHYGIADRLDMYADGVYLRKKIIGMDSIFISYKKKNPDGARQDSFFHIYFLLNSL